jgi:hypothetical protein
MVAVPSRPTHHPFGYGEVPIPVTRSTSKRIVGPSADTGAMNDRDDDWYATESANMTPRQIHQRLMAEPLPGDDEPVAIPRQRLEKVALILDLAVTDQVGNSGDARTAVQYLRTESMEQKHGAGTMAPTAAELGERIDALEWPAKAPA